MDVNNYTEAIKAGGIGFVIFLLGMIKIPKLEVNLWGWLLKMFGRITNQELMDEIKSVKKDVEELKSDLQTHIEENQYDKANTARIRVLRFNDEVIADAKKSKNGAKSRHTREHFNVILQNIDEYEKFCIDHPKFPNSQAILAIKNIKRAYDKHAKANDFCDM